MRRMLRTVMILHAFIALGAGASRAQSYGDQDQVLTIGAAEFERVSAEGDDALDSDGYVYGPTPATYYEFRAPLSLPEGARIEQLCLYANDADPDRLVGALLSAVKLVPGGGTPHETPIQHSAATSSDAGYGYFCSSGLSWSLRSTFDTDNDGTPDNVSYFVDAYFSNTFSGSPHTLGFGGVRITWKREVSPPGAFPLFADVPSGDAARRYVEALAASGVTAGCGGGNYCPDAALTRRQMAVFLAKALGLDWVD